MKYLLIIVMALGLSGCQYLQKSKERCAEWVGKTSIPADLSQERFDNAIECLRKAGKVVRVTGEVVEEAKEVVEEVLEDGKQETE